MVNDTPHKASTDSDFSPANPDLLFDPHIGSSVAVKNNLLTISKEVIPAEPEIRAMTKHSGRGVQEPAEFDKIPPPGGVGGGVNFKPSDLLFLDSTAAYYYLLMPHDLGSDPKANLLYMTSSNRASRGCEALISFFKDRNYEAAFMIWDWSVPPGPQGQFVVTMSYDQARPYRIPLSVASTTGYGQIGFEALYIVSSTRRVGSAWVNEVFLHNHQTGLRDRVWQHSFEWPTKVTDENYWWGPIFETFPDDATYNTAPPLGFFDALLVQDMKTRRLTPADSDLTAPTKSGFTVLFQRNNSGLIAQGNLAYPEDE